jgi:hypothetical protein
MCPQVYRNNEWLDSVGNSGVFKTMKGQSTIAITESRLDDTIVNDSFANVRYAYYISVP